MLPVGTFQNLIGEVTGVDQSAVSRTITPVTEAFFSSSHTMDLHVFITWERVPEIGIVIITVLVQHFRGWAITLS